MKPSVFCAIFLALAYSDCKDLALQPEPETEYYWSGGEKVQLLLNRQTVVAVYRPDPSFPDRSLEIIHFDTALVAPLRSIVSTRGLNPDLFEWLSFGYTYKASELLALNRVSFRMKSQYNIHSLDSLIENEAVFDSTKYGTVMLKVLKQEGNVFDIANKVYESGLVEYSHPDFIARITFDK